MAGKVVLAIRLPAVEACSRCGGEMWEAVPVYELTAPGGVVAVCCDCAIEKAAEVIMECMG